MSIMTTALLCQYYMSNKSLANRQNIELTNLVKLNSSYVLKTNIILTVC